MARKKIALIGAGQIGGTLAHLAALKEVSREEALMHAGRVRLRPILMTTFALIAGMMPVAIGLGEGGEFYRPMAVAIIGGTITSTLLTLLVVPTFYDSIEIARDRAVAKFRRRALRWNPFLAFVATIVEAILTLLLLRFAYRLAKKPFSRAKVPFPGGVRPDELPSHTGD